MTAKSILVVTLIIFLGLVLTGAWWYRKSYIQTFPDNQQQRSPSESNGSSPVVELDRSMERVSASGELSFLQLPPEFSLRIFSRNVPGARAIAMDPNGTLIVSLTSSGRIVALLDKNTDGAADEERLVLSGLNRPHGLAFHCEQSQCWLYVAETDRVIRYQYDVDNLRVTDPKNILDLPSDGGHSTRTLLIASLDGRDKLLISVGSSCNVCVERDPMRAAVTLANLDGSEARVFASGLRNAVFMARHPVTGDIWVTENGRDFLGDNLPPDEINILQEGKNYGWPYCYGKNVHDDSFDPLRTHVCNESETLPSHIDIQAHSAPLGITFTSGDGWPHAYQNSLLVAYHGSWNRSSPTGYKIVRYQLDDQGSVRGQEDFITGWLQPGGVVKGRPVALLAQPDGVMYISDDQAGVVYRLKVNR